MPDTYSQRPAADEHHEYYAKYIALVPEGDIIGILERQAPEIDALFARVGEARAAHRYAEGKWTIREVAGHLTDAERIFAYRTLRFARRDATELPGFEENDYVPAGAFEQRPLADVVAELQSVRAATVSLLRGLPADAMTRSGSANGSVTTARAIAWIIAGHTLHHLGILRDRYGA